MLDFLDEHESPWIQIYDEDKSIMQSQGVRGFPTMILVDEKGRVVSTSARGEQLHTMLKILLDSGEEAKAARLAAGDDEEDSNEETPKKTDDTSSDEF